MMTDFYMVGAILRNENLIHPAFSKKELRDVMWNPMPLFEIIKFKKWRKRNIFIYLIGVLPPSMSLFFIKTITKHIEFIKRLWLRDDS
jgi:hypothetical protein